MVCTAVAAAISDWDNDAKACCVVGERCVGARRGFADGSQQALAMAVSMTIVSVGDVEKRSSVAFDKQWTYKVCYVPQGRF